MKAVIQISVSIITQEGEQKIPTEGTTQELINRILALEKEVEELKQSRATTGTMGLSQVFGGGDATDWDSGLVVSAVQQNPSVPGTFANQISSINNNAVFAGRANKSTGFMSAEGFDISKKTIYQGALVVNARSYPGTSIALENDRAGITFHNPGRNACLLYLEGDGLKFTNGTYTWTVNMTSV